MPRWVQIAQGGAETYAVGVVERNWADTRRLGMVVVRAIGETGSSTGVLKGGLVRIQLVLLEPAGDYGALRAVEIIVGEVSVGLDLPEIGEALGEAPLVVTHGRPRVVVLRYTPQEDLAVDGAGAAGNLASWHHHGGRSLGGLAPELPVVVAGHDVCCRGVPKFHFIWQLLKLRIVWAGLQ